MGPVEAAQTPENATMTVPLRDVPQAGNQAQFRPSIQDALRAACRLRWMGGRICLLETPDWH